MEEQQLEISISKRRKSIKPTKRIESNPVTNPDPDPKSNPKPQKSPNQQKVKYKECQKNHAATSGGHVIDGCGEFMSSGEEGSPESLLCAACDCHRSFHRKEIDGVYVVKVSNFTHQTRPVITHQASPIMMSFGGGGVAGAPAESSTEDLNKIHHCFNKGFDFNQFQENHYHSPKKRFRTKFNKEQKEKMMEFAEKIKWRINKGEDDEVNRFCSEINVKRQVFKVWMHNHKQNQHQQQNQEEKSNKI